MKIDIQPYRGEVEPIVSVRVCHILLKDNWLEISRDFTYLRSEGGVKDEFTVKSVKIHRKELIGNVELATYEHDDAKGVDVPAVWIDGDMISTDNPVLVFNEIRKWLYEKVQDRG